MLRKRFVRTPYNYDVDLASQESAFVSEEPSMTQQSFANDCDINTIVKRFGLGYAMPVGQRMPSFGDFTGIDNYQDALHAVMEAGEAFDALPAELREKFGNDPGRFVAFASDEGNRDAMRDLGLLQEEPRSPPAKPEEVRAALAAIGRAVGADLAGTTPASASPDGGDGKAGAKPL